MEQLPSLANTLGDTERLGKFTTAPSFHITFKDEAEETYWSALVQWASIHRGPI